MVRIVLTLILAASALAQDAPPPASFFIERIEVRGARRVSTSLIVSETRLREGGEVTEEQLAAAAARLTRLPYLLSADFALEKGSDRGRHVLVINVAETKPFFFLVDTRPVLREDRGPTRFEYSDDDFGGESKDAALGFRWFVGRRGIVHLGVISENDRQPFTRDYSAVTAGYTQYDLFGSGAFATISVRLPEGRYASAVSPQLTVGVPLSANHTIALDYQDTHFRDDKIRILGTDFRRRDSEKLFSLSWTYNTTNHPFAPTRGTILRVTPLFARRDASKPVQNPADLHTFVTSNEHLRAWGIDLAASRYWELSDRNSVSAAILFGWSDVDDDRTILGNVHSRPSYQVLRASWSRNLWKNESRSGDSRLELDARLLRHQINFEDGDHFGDRDRAIQASVAWVRRSSWGMARLGIGYAWGD